MAVTVLSGGVPVEVDHRMWSFNSQIQKVHENAYVTDFGASGDMMNPRHVWRTQRNVRTVLSFLGNNVGQVPLHAFTTIGQERERLRSGRLAGAIRMPHPSVTAFEFVKTIKIDRSLFGKYAALKTSVDGEFQAVRLPPWRWKFERDTTGIPTAVLWHRADNAVVRYTLDSLIWFDGYFAGSDDNPMAALFDILTEQDEAGKYRTELWKQGARFPGWIERPQGAPKWSGIGKDTFRSGWQQYAAGGVRAGRTPILEDDMKYHELANGVTPEAAQQLESRKLSIAEVASAFHLPPVFAGLLDSTSHSNVDAYGEQLYNDVLGPDFMEMQQAFNARLVPDLAESVEDFVEFNVPEKLRLSFKDQAQIMQTQVGGPIRTRNEARKALNLPGIGPDGDELITPLNVLVGGQASPTDSAPGSLPAAGATAIAAVSEEEAVETTRQLSVAEVVQKVYLGVGKLLTAGEARKIVNEAGGDLDLSLNFDTDGGTT